MNFYVKILLLVSVLFLFGISGIVCAQIESSGNYDYSGTYQSVGTVSTQYYSPSFSSTAGYISPSVYWPEFDKDTCKERRDFIVQVAPGGCTPAVVRSDLLEEQPVPVFCKLMLIQTNPLVDVSRVKSISFQGKYPEGIYDVGYFPARYNTLSTTRNLADTPIDDNMGYFVVVLAKNPVEDDMPDWIQGNLTAVINYDLESALGVGRTAFYSSEMNSEDWLRDYKEYSFWNGKGYVRVESIESDRATISIYRDMDTKYSTFTLMRGGTSEVVYLPGFYCTAGLKVTLDEIQVPQEAALLQVDDQQVWVAKNDRIMDDKCTVKEVDAYSGGGMVSISCPVENGNFDLKLDPGKISLKIGADDKSAKDAVPQDYSIGSNVFENVYLGYSGTWGEDKEKKKFTVFVSDPYSKSDVEFRDKGIYAIVEAIVEDQKNPGLKFGDLEGKIKDAIVSEYKEKVKDFKIDDKDTGWITIIQDSDEVGKVNVQSIKIYKAGDGGQVTSTQGSYIGLEKIETGENEWKGSDTAKQYYDLALQNYKDLADFYPSEKKINEEYFETYAAEGLYEAAKLANDFGMMEDRNEFLSRLRLEHPDSVYTEKAATDMARLLKYGSSESRAVVNLKEGSYIVELLDFKSVRKEEASVNLLIDGEEEMLGLNEIHSVKSQDGTSTGETIQVMKIDDNSVELKYNKPASASESSGQTGSISKTETLDLDRNKQTAFEKIEVKLQNINLKKQVKLTLDSEVRGPRAVANFSFKIGIEKRGIQLSPEKTQEMIKNLEENIEQWESINEKLGKVIKGLKGACFATSAVLTVKNLLGGFSGESMARNEVMTKVGGWNDFCESEVSDGKYASFESCLVHYNSQIEDDVKIYAEKIQQTNDELENAREGLVERDFLDIEGQVTDRNAMEASYRNSVQGDCKAASDSFGLSKSYSNFCSEGDLDDIRDLVTLYRTGNSGVSGVVQTALKKEAEIKVKSINNTYESVQASIASNKEAEGNGWNIKRTSAYGETETPAFIKEMGSAKKDVAAGSTVIRYFIPQGYQGGDGKTTNAPTGSKVSGKDVIIKLKENDQNKGTYLSSGEFYDIEGNKLDCNENGKDKEDCKYIQSYLVSQKATKFIKADAKAYENKMLNIKDLRVKYFDRAPYKGLPAEVPFDVNNGWYVEMEYVLTGFGQPYDESGRVMNFYTCNVGENGLIEFKREADDICRYYNGVSGEMEFPGLSLSDSKKLISKAKNAISQAAKQYGKEDVIIDGQPFKTGISFGGEAGRCSDFMSPRDCNIMFNVCDPVICPASRCDLGGAYPVDNVIQTGIIGSLVLCLPNIKEGIYIPVCLSGVHAGIEGYVSILQAHRECLNESLETGRNIGICDEIQSIYMCEFFWRQLVPFADVLLPKLIESFFSQGVRGGGEYLTVQSAWDNTQSAIDYFKNEYAVNSMKAFEMRSTEEAGTEICKSFVSASYPTDFDLLTEPDSPVQYHAWFDENVMTTATPYPTSHYKVYYHIYAGNDQGAYYYVYLKDISEEFISYYVNKPGRYVVHTGYLGRGEHVDEAKDFTAPSGYKQLCININGQDECDFGKVSTSFAVDYISDQYAAEQAEQEITKSDDCIAGTPSLWSLAQPNLQAGAEELAQPELYNQGIVRVCSTYNPGKQVDTKGEYDTTNSTSDRWKDVGYCDDETIRCWLDTESVKDVIKNKDLEDSVLREVDTSIVDKGYLTYEESRAIGGEAETFINSLYKNGEPSDAGITDIVGKLNKLITSAPSNSHKARGLLLLGRLYAKIADSLNTHKKKVEGAPTAEAVNVAETNENEASGTAETETATNAEAQLPDEEKAEQNKITFSSIARGDILIKGDSTFTVGSSQSVNGGKWVIVVQNTRDKDDIERLEDLPSADISNYGYILPSYA